MKSSKSFEGKGSERIQCIKYFHKSLIQHKECIDHFRVHSPHLNYCKANCATWRSVTNSFASIYFQKLLISFTSFGYNFQYIIPSREPAHI